ncbi:MAG: hypothetical protein KBD23_05705 [Gammaproteobacteria bacterium]|nr:hypothetical protein [Gammaproteobacteria bacterium]
MISIIAACIFYCVNPAGMVAFQDRPCASSHTQRVLDDVYTYPLILASAQSDQTHVGENPLEVLVEAKKNAVIYKKEQAYQKKQKRLAAQQARQTKQAALARIRIEHRQLRCQKIREKIKNIETQLRQGCKMPKCLRLKEQLKKEIVKKDRYCTEEKS